MMIVDTPGFQNPERGGSARGASFEELCHNYAQDRLQRLFHERTFLQELERYKEVGSCRQGAQTLLHLAFWPRHPGQDICKCAQRIPSSPSLLMSALPVSWSRSFVLDLGCAPGS